jgi:ABC-2 type transport system ATP-binding protein
MTATNEPLADQAPPDSRRRSGLAELPALSIDCVSHSYGARRALKDIGFTVARASIRCASRSSPKARLAAI